MELMEIVLSKYRVLKIFKKTDNVIVCLAEHIHLNSYWIIKQLNTETTCEDYEQEISILKELRHPGIPVIVDVVKEDNTITFVREYMEGKTLSQLIEEEGVLSEQLTIQIGAKLCNILSYLHNVCQQPIIYRDLKPDNIIITDQMDVKLIDFGISRFYKSDVENDTTYLGTKGFAAPEQYGLSQSDVRTDIFGIGATLYFILTKKDLSKAPFKHSPIRTYRKDVSIILESILHKCLKLKKEDRYESVQEIYEQLNPLITNKQGLDINRFIEGLKMPVFAIAGLKAGVGVTYLTLLFAKYLVSNGLEVLIIDMSKSMALKNMEYIQSSTKSEGIINYSNIHILTKSCLIKRASSNTNPLDQKWDIVLIDLGQDLDNKISKNIYQHNLVVAGINPWEIDLFEEFVMRPSLPKIHYLINHTSKSEFSDLCKSINGLWLYQLKARSFNQSETIDSTPLFDKILERAGLEFLCSSKTENQSFSRAKYYKEKLLKLIKQ